MTKEVTSFIDYATEYYNGEKSRLNDIRSKFKELSLDAQYEILANEANGKFNTGIIQWIFSEHTVSNEYTGVGILDILNGKFQNGTTLEKMKSEIPNRLYENLIRYQPKGEKGKLASIIEGLCVFKDENGELNKEAISDYLSDPKVAISPKGLENVFQYFDKDFDRKKIAGIIEGRFRRRFGQIDNSGLDYIDTARALNGEIRIMQKGKSDLGIFDAFKKMIGVEYDIKHDDEKDGDFHMLMSIEGMYNSFKKQYREGFDETAIKSDFALCLYTAYEGITDKARTKSEELERKIAGYRYSEDKIKGGDRDGKGD